MPNIIQDHNIIALMLLPKVKNKIWSIFGTFLQTLFAVTHPRHVLGLCSVFLMGLFRMAGHSPSNKASSSSPIFSDTLHLSKTNAFFRPSSIHKKSRSVKKMGKNGKKWDKKKPNDYVTISVYNLE